MSDKSADIDQLFAGISGQRLSAGWAELGGGHLTGVKPQIVLGESEERPFGPEPCGLRPEA